MSRLQPSAISWFLLFCLDKLAWIAHRDGPCEAVCMFDLVELTLDRPAQFNLVDVPQDEE
jgi:hypothetical protein